MSPPFSLGLVGRLRIDRSPAQIQGSLIVTVAMQAYDALLLLQREEACRESCQRGGCAALCVKAQFPFMVQQQLLCRCMMCCFYCKWKAAHVTGNHPFFLLPNTNCCVGFSCTAPAAKRRQHFVMAPALHSPQESAMQAFEALLLLQRGSSTWYWDPIFFSLPNSNCHAGI